MSKKRIKAEELIFLIHQRLTESETIARAVPSIAVVPVASGTWIIVAPKVSARYHPDLPFKLARIQKELRLKYVLV